MSLLSGSNVVLGNCSFIPKIFLPLSAKKSPASFAGQALLFAARSNLLNPPNNKQMTVSKYIGKPLRSVARFIYVLVVPFLCALAGTVYHGISSIKYGVYSAFQQDPSLKAYFSKLATCHAQAQLRDIVVVCSLGFLSPANIPPHALFASDSQNIAEIVASYFNHNVTQEGMTHTELVKKELELRA